jgi:hypothetical protein
MCRLSWNGASTFRNPQGLSRPVMGIALSYDAIFIIEFFSSLGPSLLTCTLFCSILSVPPQVRRPHFTPRAIHNAAALKRTMIRVLRPDGRNRSVTNRERVMSTGCQNFDRDKRVYAAFSAVWGDTNTPYHCHYPTCPKFISRTIVRVELTVLSCLGGSFVQFEMLLCSHFSWCC